MPKEYGDYHVTWRSWDEQWEAKAENARNASVKGPDRLVVIQEAIRLANQKGKKVVIHPARE